MANSPHQRAPTYLLKVLSGPHQGAEVSLREGAYLVGSGEDCDIVLSDRLLAARHFELAVAANGIELVPLASPLLVSGAAVSNGRHRWAPFSPITAGATHLVFGPANGSAWPALDTLRLPALLSAEQPAATTTASQNGAGKVADETVTAAPAGAPQRPEHRGFSWPRFFPWVVAFTALLALFWIGMRAWLGWQDAAGESPRSPASTAAQQPPPHVEPGRQALEALRKLGFVQKAEILKRNGRATARGYVENAMQRQEAEATVRRLNNGVAATIYSDEETLASCREVIRAYSLPVSLRGAGIGIVEADGRVESPAAWERARETLSQNVPGLVELRDEKVLTGPGAPVRQTPTAANGSLPSSTAAATKPAAPGPLRLVGVRPGQMGYISLLNGRKYFVGAVLPGGLTLVAIEPTGAVFDQRGKRLRVATGEELPP